ncbi:UNVERIFIED_CONTAM: hypothetical protein Sradi_3820000 [Sesamum radiatum]|uniref:Uncharacterized protein n=1 Tax=Sesamum radiatum TaxID=300843 RepID=A0AAW2Q0L0_SESRA
MDEDSVHAAKKKLQVGDDHSNSISAVPPRAMKILAWNCQGMGPPWTVRTLTETMRLHRPGLVFISETKCKARRCDRIKESLNYHGLGVDSIGNGRRLLLFWRKDIDVWLQSFSAHHIDVMVKPNDCPARWRFTGFSGYSELAKQKEG